MKIGLIDSGIGGHTILHAAKEKLPEHEYIYFADTEHFPYSRRSTENLIELAKEHTHALIEKQGCEIIVLACNTLSVAALAAVREAFPDTKFVGTVPPVAPATHLLGAGQSILVLATERTAKSQYLQHLLQPYPDQDWVVVGSTDLVEAIEAEDSEKIASILADIKASQANKQFSGIVLGCTHFPLAAKQIQNNWPEAVLFSPSDGVVKQLSKLLTLDGAESQ
ncbi:MAG: glutamate racemase [bacterium]|nr:glutamate racemase [bacterium]